LGVSKRRDRHRIESSIAHVRSSIETIVLASRALAFKVASGHFRARKQVTLVKLLIVIRLKDINYLLEIIKENYLTEFAILRMNNLPTKNQAIKSTS